MSPALDETTYRNKVQCCWIANGDANSYAVFERANWVASIQLNGEIPVKAQEKIMDKIVAGLNAKNQ